MSGPKLFEPLTVGNLTLANRIVIAPMCQYSAVNGCMNDWHQIHLGQLALSGAALLTIEASAVLPEGARTASGRSCEDQPESGRNAHDGPLLPGRMRRKLATLCGT